MDAELATLREVRRADLPVVAALLREAWPRENWELRFRRQWFENPAWSVEVPLGWAHEAHGALLSFFGNLPLPYWIDGAPGRAFAATSLLVRPDLRRRGLSQALVRAWLEQPLPGLRVNATSNELSAGVFEKLGLDRTPRAARLEASRVARPFEHSLRGARRRTGRIPGALLIAAVAAPWVRWRRERLPAAAGWTWERQNAAESVLDELWTRVRPARASTLRRDAECLRWLYFEGPAARRNTLLLGRDAAGVPRGLAGFWADHATSQLRQVDLFGDLGEAGALASLIAAGTRRAAEQRCASARFRVPRELAGELLPWRPCEGTVYHQLEGCAAAPDTPIFCDLDGDGCLDLLT